MKLPEQLMGWDWPDTHTVPEGYDLAQVPTLSQANFQLLADRYNQLIDYLEAKERGKELRAITRAG